MGNCCSKNSDPITRLRPIPPRSVVSFMYEEKSESVSESFEDVPQRAKIEDTIEDPQLI